MRVAPRIFITLGLIGFALMATGHDATAQELDVVSIAAGQALGLDTLQRWDATVYGMERTSELVVMSRRSDASLEKPHPRVSRAVPCGHSRARRRRLPATRQ